MHALRLALAAALTTALLAGCGGVQSPSNNTTENFSGTVAPDTGSTSPFVTHSFSVTKNGEMSARLTSISPNNATLIGLAFGQVVNGVCGNVFNINTLSGLNRDVMVTPITQRGTYCIQVFNGGGVTAAQTYQLQVNHP